MDNHSLPTSTGPVVWLTGLSGAGKTTIARQLEHELTIAHLSCLILDGDDLRSGLNSDLGFSADDRLENVRRIAHVAKLISSRVHVIIVAAIAPSHAARSLARAIVGEAYREVFVDTPLAICEARDPKGLYRKARSGALKTFTGVTDIYERPSAPDLVLRTDIYSVLEETQKVLSLISSKR
jgi:adenylylsulfate kinase